MLVEGAQCHSCDEELGDVDAGGFCPYCDAPISPDGFDSGDGDLINECAGCGEHFASDEDMYDAGFCPACSGDGDVFAECHECGEVFEPYDHARLCRNCNGLDDDEVFLHRHDGAVG